MSNGDRLKEEGIAKAAAIRACELRIARMVAVDIAQKGDGTCNADQVQAVLIPLDISLGPAAGAIFKYDRWECTGQFKKSDRDSNHSRLVRVWKLVY